jgi:hypothetical protein
MTVKYKIFSPDEANATLEEVIRPAFDRLHTSIEQLARADREASILKLIVDSGASETNPDRGRHGRLQDRVIALKAEIREDIEAIRGTGALIKDLRHGLVDFFAYQDGKLVFLCWKRGEDRIRYWHSVESGFQGRRPLGERAELEDS